MYSGKQKHVKEDKKMFIKLKENASDLARTMVILTIFTGCCKNMMVSG